MTEPMLHFLLIGLAIFALYQSGSGETPDRRDDTIIVTQADINRMSAVFAATWLRQPDSNELQHLIDAYVREEVYYREGLALGLDRNDTVIRQRLGQKLEFLTDMTARVPEPSEAELQARYQELRPALTTEGRISFEQVFLGPAGSAAATQALAELRAGADPASLGRGTLLPGQMTDASQSVVDDSFGPGFFASVAALPGKGWAGPVESAFGIHLVRLNGLTPATTPPLEQVRDAVLQDWRRVKALELQEKMFQALRSHYTVTVEQAGQ